MISDTFESPQPLHLFPDKLFYKIGEVSRLVGVESYVLRYWETEFPFLKPRKSKSGQRVYTKKEIDQLLLVKKLLYEDKYTIDGVRRKLAGTAQQIEKAVEDLNLIEYEKSRQKIDAEVVLNLVRSRLKALLGQLS